MTAMAHIANPELERAAMPDWPRLMGIGLAARYLGIGVTTLRDKGPEPKRIGARVLYDRRDLDRWADSLDGQPLDAGERQAEGGAMLKRIQDRMGRGQR